MFVKGRRDRSRYWSHVCLKKQKFPKFGCPLFQTWSDFRTSDPRMLIFENRTQECRFSKIGPRNVDFRKSDWRISVFENRRPFSKIDPIFENRLFPTFDLTHTYTWQRMGRTRSSRHGRHILNLVIVQRIADVFARNPGLVLVEKQPMVLRLHINDIVTFPRTVLNVDVLFGLVCPNAGDLEERILFDRNNPKWGDQPYSPAFSI